MKPGVLATQHFKRNFLLNLYREEQILLVCFLLLLKRGKNVWHLQPLYSIWRPLVFLPVTLSQPVHSKGNQSWMLIGRTDVEAETPVVWPPHAKSWLIRKDPWEGNRQEGQWSPNGGNRLQVQDIFISLKRQEETNQRYVFSSLNKFKKVSLKMLCCHDTWFHLKLTTLKPWVNQYISFSYGNVVLCYVNVPQTLSSSWFRQVA